MGEGGRVSSSLHPAPCFLLPHSPAASLLFRHLAKFLESAKSVRPPRLARGRVAAMSGSRVSGHGVRRGDGSRLGCMRHVSRPPAIGRLSLLSPGGGTVQRVSPGGENLCVWPICLTISLPSGLNHKPHISPPSSPDNSARAAGHRPAAGGVGRGGCGAADGQCAGGWAAACSALQVRGEGGAVAGMVGGASACSAL